MPKSVSPNLIWGTAFSADLIYDSLPDAEKENVIFTDNNPEKWGTSYHGRPVYAPEKAFKLLRSGVIEKIYMGVAINHFQDIYDEICAALGDSGNIKFWALTIDGKFELLNFSNGSKPTLNYFELDAIRLCNLNCRGCSHFSNLETEPQIYTLEMLEKDFHRLSVLFESVRYIRVMGGEPLLHPHLIDILAGIKSFFPKVNLSVLSNGLLVPKMDGKLAKFMENEIELHITQYEVTKPMMDDIRRFCSDKGIKVKEYGYDRDSFLKWITLDNRDTKNPNDSLFRSCPFKRCTTLYKGKFYRCSSEAYISTFNNKYGTELPQNTGISIYEAQTGQEIIDYLNHASALCKHCVKPVKVDWKNNKQDALISDWIVE